jgi:FkbM family methyltransferase
MKSLMTSAINASQRLFRPLGLRATRTVAGHRFVFDAATDIGMQLLFTGSFEEEAIMRCAQYIRPDGMVIDVGANIGLHAVRFADMANAGKVICFEPARSTFAYLLQNTKGAPNVVPLNIALSDISGLQNFFVAADNAFSGLKDTHRKPILRQEAVACFAGDAILPPLVQGQRVDLVKIDVEGLETQVLLGMKEFIARHRPVIFCEIFGGKQSNPDPQATVELCMAFGYDPFVLRAGQLVAAREHSDEFYNYFLLPRQRS